jgi:hypothetical protein
MEGAVLEGAEPASCVQAPVLFCGWLAVAPFTPMCRRDLKSFSCRRFDPSGQDAPARKNKSMGTIAIENCQFQIQIKRSI